MFSLPRRPLPAVALAAGILAVAAVAPVVLRSSGDTGSARAAVVQRPKGERPVVRRPKPTRGEQAAKFALDAVGVPYRWGGMSPAAGFDCSGLVSWAYGRVGVELPHSSYALYGEGRRIARSRMRPGDILFFSGLGHVGLYVGRGRMVHAPYSGRRVEIVRLGGGSHYGHRLVAARRVVAA